MPDKFTDRARKAAEEIQSYCDLSSSDCDRVAGIIERHMREVSQENYIHPNDFEPMAFASWRKDNY